ncbi:MAG: RNA methyltransferase [Bacteroidales bacterium]|nr:RNA methyltransferase [Bacteroidales bacterium]
MEEPQLKQQLTATTLAGLEDVLAEELKNLGAENIIPQRRAVSFTGDEKMIYQANLWCRTALRILKPIKEFKLAEQDELYNELYTIPWEEYFTVNKTIAVDSIVHNSVFTHSYFLALRSKDAIADRFRDNFRRRPSVDKDNPDVQINIHLTDNHCIVSLDSSGVSLHKRGYRVKTGAAPINEVLAAGIIKKSGWDGNSTFVDPMCGSGTLLIEAALIAFNIPPANYRNKFCFMHWLNFDNEAWEAMRNDALNAMNDNEHSIIGIDISKEQLAAARLNLKRARLHKDIELYEQHIADVEPPQEPGIMMTNPPYGERIKVENNIKLYKQLGDTMKQNFKGYKAWIVSGDLQALKHIGLKPTQKHTVYNGPIECRLAEYELYAGSKK